MSDERIRPVQTNDRRAVLLRQLSDARAILGCGDDPDRNAAYDEIERVERELGALSARAADEERRNLTPRVLIRRTTLQANG